MTKYTQEEIEKFAGEEHYKRPPRLQVDEIRLHGNEGKFVKARKEDDKWVTEPIGPEIRGVILRVRRRLVDFPNKINSSEHNTKKDTVFLFGPNVRGPADSFRETYQGLRTNQVLYMLMLDAKTSDQKVLRVIVRGASLGSQNKPEGSVSFYEYLNSFGDEHVWQYETKMVATEEQGQLGKYYAISFEKGKKLDEKEQDRAFEEMKNLHKVFSAQDSFFRSEGQKASTAVPDTVPDVAAFPEEGSDEEAEIKPENVPF